MIRISPSFLARIRRQTRDDRINLFFAPRFRQVHPDGKATGKFGAWVLTRKVKVPFVTEWRGRKLACTRWVEVPQYALDGGRGMPRTPGQWLINACVMADTNRRGVAVLRELEALRKKDKAAMAAESDEVANKMAEIAGPSLRSFALAHTDKTCREDNIARGRRMEEAQRDAAELAAHDDKEESLVYQG